MMLTREQAGAAWCPMVRTARNQIATYDDGAEQRRNPPASRCIADGCAMWRWSDRAPVPRPGLIWWAKEDEPLAEPERPADVPADAVWVPLTGEGEDLYGGWWEEPQAKVDAENTAAAACRRGYCGLAGAPVVHGGTA